VWAHKGLRGTGEEKGEGIWGPQAEIFTKEPRGQEIWGESERGAKKKSWQESWQRHDGKKGVCCIGGEGPSREMRGDERRVDGKGTREEGSAKAVAE